MSEQLAGVLVHAEGTGEMQAITNADHEYHDTRFVGVRGAPGIAIGTAVVLQPTANLETVPDRKPESITVELTVFDRAINQVRADIGRIHKDLENTLPAEEHALFDAYLHMLDDSALAGEVRAVIREGQWAQGALRRVILDRVRAFEQMEDSYLRERGADVRELGHTMGRFLSRPELAGRIVVVGCNGPRSTVL